MGSIRLDSQTLGDIVVCMCKRSESAGQELRRSARVALQVRIVIAEQAGHGIALPWNVIMRDLSQTGIGFYSGRPVREGAMLGILLPGNHGLYEGVWAKTAFVRTAATGLYKVGAQFVESVMDEGILRQLRAEEKV